MRRIDVRYIMGNEILAKPIWNNKGVMLMPDGTVLKREYIGVLKDLGINYIAVEDNKEDGPEIFYNELVKEETKENCQQLIQTIVNKKFVGSFEEANEFRNITNTLMNEVLNDEYIVLNLTHIRSNDTFAYEHSVSVCAMATIVALKLGVPKDITKEYSIGALLHDIGLTYIPSYCTDKPEEELSFKELNAIRRHVVYGYDALKDKNYISKDALRIVLYHHERLDGSGYPKGLKGTEIDYGSRIVAVCDTFDTMMYGKGEKIKVYEAMEYLQAYSKLIFDEKIVKAFMESIALYPIGSKVITNEGDYCTIFKQNKGFPARPVLRIIKGKDGIEKKTFILKDLLQDKKVFITDLVE